MFERELDSLITNWKRIKRKNAVFARSRADPPRDQRDARSRARSVHEKVELAQRRLAPGLQRNHRVPAPASRPTWSIASRCTRAVSHSSTSSDIEKEIRDLFKRRCDLPSGGYLIIEPTEALVSIDVNSGRYTGKSDPEKTILRRTPSRRKRDRAAASPARHRRHHRLRLHRHGDAGEP